MSESPIRLRGKGGGVVFQGTQSPGGGSQPGAVRMLGPFTIGPDDFVGPDGFGFRAAPIYTPTAGDSVIGFAWILRSVFSSGSLTDGFQIAPQTSADTGTAGPALLPPGAVITLINAQGQGPGNTGGDYCAASVLPPTSYGTASGILTEPSTFGPVISDGTPLWINGAVTSFDPGGQIDIYVYVATPALA